MFFGGRTFGGMAAIEARGIQKNVSGKWGIAMKILNFGSLNIDYVYKVDHIVQRGGKHSIPYPEVYSAAERG